MKRRSFLKRIVGGLAAAPIVAASSVDSGKDVKKEDKPEKTNVCKDGMYYGEKKTKNGMKTFCYLASGNMLYEWDEQGRLVPHRMNMIGENIKC